MKKLSFIFSILISIVCSAQYTSPGSNLNWNFDSLSSKTGAIIKVATNKYRISQDLIISSTDTLRVDSNLIIEFDANIELEILGSFIINPKDSTVFTASNQAQRYAAIRIDNSNGSYINNGIFEYGGGINVLDSDFIIENCTFRFNESGNDGAIDLFRSDLIIRNNRFQNNEGPAISSGANIASAPKIINNRIEANVGNGGNKSQINFGATGSDTMLIIGNTIKGYYDNAGGIAVFPLGSANVVIDSNVIDSNRYGIAILNTNVSSIITRNKIINNDIQGSPNLGGSGINFNGDATNRSIVSKNEIRGNLWGITIQNSAKPNIGDLRTSNYNVGLNEIYNNGNGGQSYNIFNNTSDSIYAQNNIWNYATIQDVENTISHEPDDPNLGYVNYLPVAQLITSLTNNVEDNSLTKLFPNPIKNNFTIEAEFKIDRVEWYDIQGKLVRFDRIGSKLVKLSEPSLKGQYFLKLIGEDKIEIKKVLIK